MKKSDKYLKIVEWSDEDGCYIGRAPGLMLGGVHGDDEAKFYKINYPEILSDLIQYKNLLLKIIVTFLKDDFLDSARALKENVWQFIA